MGIVKDKPAVLQDNRLILAIIIVNWNTRPLLERCLRSLAQGLGSVDAQVLVVDNGSTDGSDLVVQEFPQVELIRNSQNVGFARANNQGYQRIRGSYVLLLNPDTEVKPHSIERMVHFLNAYPQRAGVTAVLRNPDGTIQRYHKRLPRWRYLLFSETILRNLFPRNKWVRAFYMQEQSFHQVTEIEQPPAACLMLRRSVLDPNVLFDERFPIFYNDVDLCRRLHDHKHQLFLLPEAEVMHYGGAGGVGELPDQGIVDSLIGLIRYYRKHEGLFSAVGLWLILTANSLLVLGGGLGKVALGRRSMRWWIHELGKRGRLAIGKETFRYPSDMSSDLNRCVIPCR